MALTKCWLAKDICACVTVRFARVSKRYARYDSRNPERDIVSSCQMKREEQKKKPGSAWVMVHGSRTDQMEETAGGGKSGVMRGVEQ